MTASYRVVGLNALERSGAHPATCAVCGHEDLKRPVKLEGPGGVLWVGEGCAANLLYGRMERADKTRARRAAREATDVVEAAEAKARSAASDADSEKWQAFLDAEAPAKFRGERFLQIEHMGGYARARAAFLSSTTPPTTPAPGTERPKCPHCKTSVGAGEMVIDRRGHAAHRECLPRGTGA